MGVINRYRDSIDAITIAPASWDDLSYIDYLQSSDTWKKLMLFLCELCLFHEL